MSRSAMALAAALAFFAAGCLLPRGSIEELAPILRDKLPASTRVWVKSGDQGGKTNYFERRERDLAASFSAALAARGVAVAAGEKDAEAILALKIVSWEYNDAGFAGFGPRDDITVGVILQDAKSGRVKARATVRVDTDRRIVDKFVERMFEPREGAKP